MLAVDFHCHSLFSHCGLHTHVELLTRARELGLAGLAITDHGPDIGGRVSAPFFERLHDPVPGIRLLKGMESNLRGCEGEIDVPAWSLKFLDILLLGLHPNTPAGLGAEENTRILLAALARNPAVDLVTHPADAAFPVDFDRLATAAAATGVALELNNSKLLLSRVDRKPVHALVRACKAAGCRMAVCSDAHALNEIGLDDFARRVLRDEAFPAELLVNDTAEKAFAFIAERRAGKRSPA